MFIEVVRNRNSPPCTLLRETFRQDGKVKHRTLANLSKWPKVSVEALRAVLRGLRGGDGPGGVAGGASEGDRPFKIVRSLPHGHVVAVMSAMRSLGLPKLLSSKPCAEASLCMAMVAARILFPGSKLAVSRALGKKTAVSTLAQECCIPQDPDENRLYAAMDWLLHRQASIEKALAARHLGEGSLILYDLSSSYMEGKTCPLAKRGHSRDGKTGKLQIEYGLLCSDRGIPVAVEVFEGNTADSATVGAQVEKLRDRFGLRQVVLVGDRGMITQARISQDLLPVDGIGWISALRSCQIAGLVREGLVGQSLFDEKNLAEIQSPDYPGERLVACRNPFLAEARTKTRQELLKATERELEKIRLAVARIKSPLRGKGRIGLRAGRVVNKFKMAKHFSLTIGEDAFAYARRQEKITAEAALDGIYVVRAGRVGDGLSAADLVERYKSLRLVEAAFRSLKTVDLKVRHVHHRVADRVRAHVFLCTLAYYVEWHMRQALKPMLFDDEEQLEPGQSRPDPVAQKQPSASAAKKARTKLTADGQPAHSFQTLLGDLATLCRNTIKPGLPSNPSWTQDTEPTTLQQKAFALLNKITVM